MAPFKSGTIHHLFAQKNICKTTIPRPKNACVFCALQRKKCVHITDSSGAIVGCTKCRDRGYVCSLVPDLLEEMSSISTFVDDDDDSTYIESDYDHDNTINAATSESSPIAIASNAAKSANTAKSAIAANATKSANAANAANDAIDELSTCKKIDVFQASGRHNPGYARDATDAAKTAITTDAIAQKTTTDGPAHYPEVSGRHNLGYAHDATDADGFEYATNYDGRQHRGYARDATSYDDADGSAGEGDDFMCEDCSSTSENMSIDSSTYDQEDLVSISSADTVDDLQISDGVQYEDCGVRIIGGGVKVRVTVSKPNSFFHWLDSKKSYGSRENDVLEFVHTKCRGNAKFFTIKHNESHDIKMEWKNKRVRFNARPTMRFIETRNLTVKGLRGHCHGAVVMFCEEEVAHESNWKLGVVDSLQYGVLDESGNVVDVFLRLYEWKVQTNDRPEYSTDLPWAFSQKEWSKCQKHFVHRTFKYPDQHLHFAFVNQVCGAKYAGYRSDTYNATDGGLQSSPSGPDRFEPLPPKSDLQPIIRRDRVHVAVEHDFFNVDHGKFKRARYYKKSLDKFKTRYLKSFVGYQYLVANQTVLTRYSVVSCVSGNFATQSLRFLKPSMKDNFVIPYLTDSLRKSYIQRFHVISPVQLKELISFHNKNPKSFFWQNVGEVDNLIQRYCTEDPISIRNMNARRVSENEDGPHFMNSIIFAGSSAPRIDNPGDNWETPYIDTSRETVIDSRVSQNGWCQDYCPVAACYFTALTHQRQFDENDVQMAERTVACPRGTCHRRVRQGPHKGFLMYSGKRSDDAVLMPSVHQGPGDLGKFNYSTQDSISILMPRLLSTLNYVASKTVYASRYFYKHLHLTVALPLTYLWIASMVILTLDFYNCSHCDAGDSDPSIMDLMVQELESVIDDESRCPNRNKIEASNYLVFVKEFGNPLPSTCCYQRINSIGTEAESWKSHYYFVMDGLSSSFEILDQMTITFCGSVFQHNTSVPIYTCDKGDGTFDLCVGKHSYITWLAWGGTKNSSKSK